MPNPDVFRVMIAQIKEMLGEEKEKTADIESLVKKKIERDVGLWEYSFDELEQELFKRVSSLEGKKDCLSFPDISSPRKGIGWLITLIKKTLMKITHPYARMVPDRQDQFNRELIPILLASILSLQKIKDRLNAAEGQIKDLLENQIDLAGTCFDLSKSIDKVEKK
jgi:hypothetical protein